MSATPGPWEWREGLLVNHARREAVVYPDATGDFLRCAPIDKALIAAAPELLAELENAEWSSDGSTPLGACPRCALYSSTGHAPDCTLAAALKKAKGL